jgi:hypothetical protein
VSGSEKIPLLRDERLAKLLDTKGITLDVRKAGSREIATFADLEAYDVAVPAGQPAAEKIRLTAGAKPATTVLHPDGHRIMEADRRRADDGRSRSRRRPGLLGHRHGAAARADGKRPALA